MRIAGHNLIAIVVAAILMYFVEFLIYGVLIPEDVYRALSHVTAEEGAAMGWKMPFGLVGPLIWATGLSVAMGWRKAEGWQAGAMTGFICALFFMIAARFYQWGYGPTGLDFYALDAVHFLLVGAIGGAVLGAWPKAKGAS